MSSRQAFVYERNAHSVRADHRRRSVHQMPRAIAPNGFDRRLELVTTGATRPTRGISPNTSRHCRTDRSVRVHRGVTNCQPRRLTKPVAVNSAGTLRAWTLGRRSTRAGTTSPLTGLDGVETLG